MARRPACGSSAARVRRPGPPPRRAPRARAAPRANRPPRRSRRPGRPARRSSAGTVASVKSSASTVGTSVPAERHRDAGVGRRPDGVDRRDRPVLGVLVVVEEDAVALLLPPLRRRDRRGPPLDVAGDGQGGAAHLGVGPAPLDPDVDVDAARAGGLRPADEPDAGERLAGDERDLADLRPGDARHRIEVDPQLVGMVEVVGPDRVRIEVDAAEVGDPGQPGRLVEDDLVGGPAGRERQRRDPKEVGPVLGGPLLEEEVAGGAIDEALERHRPAAYAAQRAVGDRQVVADEVELRVAGLREVDLVRVRDGHVAIADPDDLLAGRHPRTIPRRGAAALDADRRRLGPARVAEPANPWRAGWILPGDGVDSRRARSS